MGIDLVQVQKIKGPCPRPSSTGLAQKPIEHKPWSIETVTDCQDNNRLSRQFQTFKTAADYQDCQDSYRMTR